MRTARLWLILVSLLVSPAVYADVAPDADDDWPEEVKACWYVGPGFECEVNGEKGNCKKSKCNLGRGDEFCYVCLDEDGTVPGSGCDCSSVGTPAAREFGAFLFAALFSLVFFFGRFKRARRER